MTFLVSLLIGVFASVVIWNLLGFEKDLNPEVAERLNRIKNKRNDAEKTIENENKEISFTESEYKYPELGEILNKFSFTPKIKQLLELSDVNWYVDTFYFFSLVSAIPFLFFLFTPFPLMSIFGVFALFFPTIYLKQTISKRFFEFSKQFPDALNLMASSLRAGHPLFSAIDIVTQEMPKPISDVFATAQKDIALGIDTKEAFVSMSKLMPQSIDLRFFITAVLIQKEVGGNLAELLDKLSMTIRDRFKLLGQLRVQTAQTRISGLVLAVVPLAVLLIIGFMNPTYVKPLFNTPDGKLALVGAICLIILGLFSIKKISSIDI